MEMSGKFDVDKLFHYVEGGADCLLESLFNSDNWDYELSQGELTEEELDFMAENYEIKVIVEYVGD